MCEETKIQQFAVAKSFGMSVASMEIQVFQKVAYLKLIQRQQSKTSATALSYKLQ
jgi:hypothetical protein